MVAPELSREVIIAFLEQDAPPSLPNLGLENFSSGSVSFDDFIEAEQRRAPPFVPEQHATTAQASRRPRPASGAGGAGAEGAKNERVLGFSPRHDLPRDGSPHRTPDRVHLHHRNWGDGSGDREQDDGRPWGAPK